MSDLFHYLMHVNLLPDAEKQPGRVLRHQLHQLDTYIGRFEAALGLAQHADGSAKAAFDQRHALVLKRANREIDSQQFRREEEPLRRQMDRLAQWSGIALRDAALTVFHFRSVLISIPKLLDMMPTAKRYVDQSELSKALLCFESHFPHAEQARHATAHAAQNVSSPQKVDFNSSKQGFSSPDTKIAVGAQFTMIDVRDGNSMHATLGGEVVSVTLNSVSLNHFQEVRRLVRRAVEPLAAAMMAARQARQPLASPPFTNSSPPR